ncbi:MAG TPA: hypothetical protein EYP56_11575, partial [Planctomycetaceae bacterium]|nr:hypothetical protein [Planctomycetaceae bacterium]
MQDHGQLLLGPIGARSGRAWPLALLGAAILLMAAAGWLEESTAGEVAAVPPPEAAAGSRPAAVDQP